MIYNTQQSSHSVQDITDIGLVNKKQTSEDLLTQGGKHCNWRKGLDESDAISEFQNVRPFLSFQQIMYMLDLSYQLKTHHFLADKHFSFD